MKHSTAHDLFIIINIVVIMTINFCARQVAYSVTYHSVFHFWQSLYMIAPFCAL